MKLSLPLSKNSGVSILGYLAIVLPLAIYFIAVFHYAVNIPFWDEFDAALDWLLKFNEAGIGDKARLLIRQHGEHRIFSYYAMVLINYLMMGEINFRFMTIAGNLAIIILIILLYYFLPAEKRNMLFFIPVVLLLTPPMGHITDMSLMTMNGVVQYVLIMASLWFLNKSQHRFFILAVILAIAATFSFGSGLFVFIAGYIILFLEKPMRRNKIAVWSLFAVISVLSYFSNYVLITQGKPGFYDVDRSIGSLMFFAAFFANNFFPFFGKQLLPVILLGCFILLFCLWLVISRWKCIKMHPVTLGLMFFIVSVAAVISFSRIGIGIEVATADRYRLITALFLALMYILVLQCFPEINKWVMVAIMLGSLLFYAGRTMYGFHKLEKHKTLLTEGMKTYYETKTCPKTLFPDESRGTWILDESVANNIYRLNEP